MRKRATGGKKRHKEIKGYSDEEGEREKRDIERKRETEGII